MAKKELKWKLIVDTKSGKLSLDRFRKSQDGVTTSMKKTGKESKSLGKSFMSLKGMIVGLAGAAGLALLGRSFLKTADMMERYKTQLTVLTGSQAKANEMFKDMAKFAGTVPFQFKEIMDAAVTLTGVMDGDIKKVGEWMPLIADLAAARGFSIQDTTGQILRMYS
ncbi:unnamed protein product, partial [marine sediment metagenome]